MTTSGTTGQTTIEVADIIDHAARRCGVMPSMMSPENVQLLKNNLFMLLSNLSNRGINLWKIERSLLGIYPGQASYSLSVGTLDVLEALYRTPQRLSATVTSSAGGTTANAVDGDVTTVLTQGSPGGNVQFDFGTPQNVYLVGLLPSGAQTLNLVFEASSNASTWVTTKTVGSYVYSDNIWQWYEIDPAPAYRYFRVRETSTGTIVMREIYVAQTWTEITIARMNRDDYSSLPNKKAPGTPLQYWFDRALTPTVNVWQVPTTTFALISLFLHKYIEDVGQLSNTLDIPQRCMNALVANLAFNSVLELPGADVKRYDALKDQAMTTMRDWEAEERDASDTNWTANIRPYTA